MGVYILRRHPAIRAFFSTGIDSIRRRRIQTEESAKFLGSEISLLPGDWPARMAISQRLCQKGHGIMKRLVKVLSADEEGEVRVPPSCVPVLVPAEGEVAELRVSPAGLVMRPVVTGDSQRQAALLADEMEGLEERIEEVLTSLPEPSDAALEYEIPYDVDTEVVTTLECVLDRDVAPAIRSLRGAASVTPEDLRAHWEQERAARERQPGAAPPGKAQ
jgi:hypothetical protein